MEPNKEQVILPGEWISSSDSLSGLSVRKDRMAFYTNNKFNGEDVAAYQIMDSVEIKGKNKKILSTYLIANGIDDTTSYKITNRDLKSISIQLKNGRIEMFTLKKK